MRRVYRRYSCFVVKGRSLELYWEGRLGLDLEEELAWEWEAEWEWKWEWEWEWEWEWKWELAAVPCARGTPSFLVPFRIGVVLLAGLSEVSMRCAALLFGLGAPGFNLALARLTLPILPGLGWSSGALSLCRNPSVLVFVLDDADDEYPKFGLAPSLDVVDGDASAGLPWPWPWPCPLAVAAVAVWYRHALSLLRDTQFVQGNLRSHCARVSS